ncbi:MAG: hypothetical protein O7F73_12915 [Gammaproteobacteria bacterium]|nr:hypothetical protein [Gammaproteobacteria bacterium]
MTPCLMVQGTSPDAGKSILVTDLCVSPGLDQPAVLNLPERREAQINRLADSMEQHLDFSALFPKGWIV